MVKVLVIDDDPAFRKLVDGILSRAQYDVVDAKDGIDGLRRFRTERPDIVISDIVMPEMEGFEVIRAIRAMAPQTPIVAMSGGGDTIGTTYLPLTAKLGADAVLAKPFRPAELTELMERLVGRESAPAEAIPSCLWTGWARRAPVA